MKLTVKMNGTDALLKKFKSFGKEGESEVIAITKIKAFEIEAEAKRLAPVDHGKLKQSIRAEQQTKKKWYITAYERYAAYMEFGTGGLVEIPTGWEAMASQFKGKGIKRINITPRPFLYPAFKKGAKLYKKDLKDSLEHLIKKYNKK